MRSAEHSGNAASGTLPRFSLCAIAALALTGGHMLLHVWLVGVGDASSAAALATVAAPYGCAWLVAFGTMVALTLALGHRDDRVDQETGLWTRLHVAERLREEVQRANRTGTPLAVVLVELPGIGAAGRHLHTVASTLRATCRASDLLGRYEHDSFVVVTPETDSQGALALARRIRASVLLRYVVESRALPPAAIALGVTHLDAGCQVSQEALVHAATEALERARQMGGDCAVLASPRQPMGSDTADHV